MNDKRTIAQQLEAERDYLLEKIRLLCSEKTDLKSQLQKMQALLERWVKELDGCLISANVKPIYDDTKALLKEAKEVKDE